jgi:hypothetical protein
MTYTYHIEKSQQIQDNVDIIYYEGEYRWDEETLDWILETPDAPVS